MLGTGLNTVVEPDMGSLVDTARSQLRRQLAVEERSDYTAVEQVGNSLWLISVVVKRLVFVGSIIFLLFNASACKLRSYSSCVDFANIRKFNLG